MPETQTTTGSVRPEQAERVRQGLDSLRLRLLDLTSRNKLVSFRHTRATIRIVDASLDSIHSALVAGAKLPFVYVPEPTKEEIAVRGEKPPARDYASSLGWSVGYDLKAGEGREDFLPVLHHKDEFDTLIRKVNTTAKTAIDETGVNLLHLVFGFLEWRESDDSTQVRYAPLVVVPVKLELPKSAQEDRSVRLYYDGEDLNTNLSIVEKMRRDFGIELPLLGEGEQPASYFARVQAAVEHKRDWRICRQISMGLLSFAKLLMYLDLDAERWPDLGLAKHPRLLDVFASEKSSELSFASEYELDEEAKRAPLPALVCDADSSQHSALLDASRGSNLVIEGPPGTGKSQTITNLIAASLAQGKRILFVAEKMAALDVVKRRLDHARLGDFCLELHSHKTNKVTVLKSLDDRIQAHPSFSDPVMLEYRVSTLEGYKETLSQYVKLMNEPYAAIRKSPFELIWTRDALRARFQHETVEVTSVAFPKAGTWDVVAFENRKNAVEIYRAHLMRYTEFGGSVNDAANPWSWLPTYQLDFAQQDSLLAHLETLRGVCEAHVVLLQAFVNRYRDRTVRPEDWFPQFAGWPDALAQLGQSHIPELLEAFVSVEHRSVMSEFTSSVSAYRDKKDALPNADNLLDGALIGKCVPLIEALQGKRLSDFTVEQLASISDRTDDALRQSAPAEATLRALADALEVDATFSIQCLEHLQKARHLVDAAPMKHLHLRKECFEADGFSAKLRTAQRECEELAEQRTKCAADFDLDHISGTDTLEEASTTLKTTSWIMRFFSTPFRNAKQLYAGVCLHDVRKVPPAQMANGLDYLSGQLRKQEAYQKKYAEDDAIGPMFDGLKTNWNNLLELAAWYEQVMAGLPDHVPFSRSVRNALLKLPTARLRSIKEGSAAAMPAAELAALSETLGTLHRSLPHLEFERTSASIDDFLQRSKAVADPARELLSALAPLKLPPSYSATEIQVLFKRVASLRSHRDTLAARAEIERLIGSRFRGSETECGGLDETVTFATCLMESELPAELKIWLMHEDYASRSEWLREWLSDHKENATLMASTKAELEAIFEKPLVFKMKDSVPALELIMRSIDACMDAAHLLPMWVDVKHALHALEDFALDALVEALARKGLPPKELSEAFEFLFYDSLLRLLFNEHPPLWRLSGTTHEETRRKFADLDKDVIELTQLKIAFAASRRQVPHGYGGKPKEKTDLALIQHEINKQRSHIPVRQLLSRAGRAVQALKPCFMMSPMSVAQFLEPGTLKFDIIVMDEASQLRPEDALGAIARGTQLVVVGDPKQLPPTTFFQRAVLDEDDNEDKTVAEEGESILDISLGLYQPVRRLRWHYRSQHHSLIAFSNGEFYDDNLVVFPSAYHEHPDLGVKFVGIPGIFERRRNQIEAERVVEAILEHMQKHPSDSLGVVTMNFDQRELIEELLYARLQNDSFSSTWVEQRDETTEPFFIKNLENVQGDERDVIFISVTYGRDSQGNIFQRFSGVNSQSGHRRLNVMVTRAKKRTVVFSSLDPNDINVTPSTPWGVRTLKGYLDFAKSGITSQPIISPGAESSNEHEAAIGTVLKEHGFEVVPQVGVSGYFIDLAVCHPRKQGTFLLGIEFDGKSYHSGRSARDRDRLRQMTLESQGWKIHRIWSTDWFKNRVFEVDRLLRKVRDLSEAAQTIEA